MNAQIDDIDWLCINGLRFLPVDPIQKADYGHSGLPLGTTHTKRCEG